MGRRTRPLFPEVLAVQEMFKKIVAATWDGKYGARVGLYDLNRMLVFALETHNSTMAGVRIAAPNLQQSAGLRGSAAVALRLAEVCARRLEWISKHWSELEGNLDSLEWPIIESPFSEKSTRTAIQHGAA